MTATTYNSNLLYAGLRELSQVTNTFAGYLISGGAAYTLQTPWQADKLEWFNYTKYGTNTNNVQGVWFRDMPTGDALIINRGTTTLSTTLETTNGVTVADVPSQFVNEHLVISGISTATPAVVTTSTAHGLANGDRVVLTKIAGAVGSILNNYTYVVRVLTSTTFALYDVYGVPISNIGAYTSGGQVTKTGPELYVQNSQPVYALTLGTAVMGADGDVIYVQATKFNSYFNFGDVGA